MQSPALLSSRLVCHWIFASMLYLCSTELTKNPTKQQDVSSSIPKYDVKNSQAGLFYYGITNASDLVHLHLVYLLCEGCSKIYCIAMFIPYVFKALFCIAISFLFLHNHYPITLNMQRMLISTTPLSLVLPT